MVRGEMLWGLAAALGLLLLPSLGVSRVMAVAVFVDPEVQGFAGEPVTLRCTFKSSAPISPSLAVDWSYRSPNDGPTETIFHYLSSAYPPTSGHFKDRISWAGNIEGADASITIKNLTLKDNGTFTCIVRNPPDVHSDIVNIMLTVIERAPSFQLSVVAFLSLLVFLPSAVVVTLLLVRMGRKFRILGRSSKPRYKKSSIEVAEGADLDKTPGPNSGLRERVYHCCAACFQDSDDEYEDEGYERMRYATDRELS